MICWVRASSCARRRVDLCADLGDAAAQLLHLPGDGVSAGVEQVLLAGQKVCDFQVGLSQCDQRGGKGQAVRAVSFSLQPGATGAQFGEAGLRHDQFGRQLGRIEADKDLPFVHPVTFTDQKLGHDTTIRVLDRLSVAVDFNLT